MHASQQQREIFETADLTLASFVRCRGFVVFDIRREHDRIVFQFLDSMELRHAIMDYINDGTIAVRSFCSTLRALKSLTRDPADERLSTHQKAP